MPTIPSSRVTVRGFVPVVALLLVVAFATAGQGQTFLQGFDENRDGPPAPFATRGFVTSPYYAAVRQALVNRYGGAIAFGSPSWPNGVPAVTAEVLREADVFVVTGMTVTLSAEEVCLLEAFVAHGGAVLSFRSEWTPPTVLGTQLGSFGGRAVGDVIDPASPVINGRFGVVASTVSMGMNSEYLRTGAGRPVLADSKRVVLVTFGPDTGHVGRAVVVGDEEIFLNGPTPFGASYRGTLANNQLLFANIVDYLIGAPGLDADGVEALGVCSDKDRDGSDDFADCDDSSPSTFPSADEVLDGVDNDCDGEVDEGLDDDGDGVPDLWDGCGVTPSGVAVDPRGCEVPCVGSTDADADGVPAERDCDDGNAQVHPGAPELPGNQLDEDCDGSLGACDPNGTWKNHGQFVACVTREVQGLVQTGQISEDLGDALIGEAAQSGVGRKRGK